MRRYLTVSIPYVNAAPHLGYALELVQADALARAWRSRGHDVRFLGGTDDHALKNVLAAESEGVATGELVDRNAQQFVALGELLGVSFDDFIRTSRDPRHAPSVERLWQASAEKGDFYRRFYEGWYCVGCEQFYAEDDLVDRRCPDHAIELEWVGEENWFFRLSRYQDAIERALTSGELVIRPGSFATEALAFVRSGLEDFSVSRSRGRARGWGIPVPGDPDQVVYVWWDALANYVSALGYGTDEDAYREWWLEADDRVHLIGKGILRFHAVYWPALLLSAGLPLPTQILVHPYLTANGRKLSKSTGNVVDPSAVVDEFGVDALRWWLLADVPRAADADFTDARLVARANDDLANGIGNLANRVATMLHRFGDGRVPAEARSAVIARGAYATEAGYETFDFRAEVAEISTRVESANRLIEATRPWVLARTARAGGSDAQVQLAAVLGDLVDTVRGIGVSLQPLVPELARQVGAALQPDGDGRIPDPQPVFPRFEIPAPEVRGSLGDA